MSFTRFGYLVMPTRMIPAAQNGKLHIRSVMFSLGTAMLPGCQARMPLSQGFLLPFFAYQGSPRNLDAGFVACFVRI